MRAPGAARADQHRSKAFARFEAIRVAGALRMGLIKRPEEAATRQHTPKIAFCRTRQGLRALASGKELLPARSICWCGISMGKLHHAMMGTCAGHRHSGGHSWHLVNLAAGAASAAVRVGHLRHPGESEPRQSR